MKNLSSLVDLDLVRATVNHLIHEYEELKDVADTQLQSGYSKGWWKDLHASTNKIEALKELNKLLLKLVESPDAIKLKRKGTRTYCVLKYMYDVVALINPSTIKSIYVSDSQRNCIHVNCRCYYEEYGEMVSESVAFYGDYITLEDIDMETATKLNPNAILWDRNPVLSDFNQAFELKDEVYKAYRTIRSKYDK